MIMGLAGIVGGMGLICIISRRTLLGIMIGIQLLFLGASIMFVAGGIISGAVIEGHLFGLFIAIGGIAQLGGGLALAVRLFYLKNTIQVDQLQSLKQ